MPPGLCALCYQPADPSLSPALFRRCAACVADPVGHLQRPELQRSIAATLGIPDGALLFHAIGRLGRHHGTPDPNWLVVYFGTVADGAWNDVRVWRQQVFYRGSPLFLEVYWHPQRGQVCDLQGADPDDWPAANRFAQRALSVLRSASPDLRGRREWTGVYRSAEQCRAALFAIIQQLDDEKKGTGMRAVAAQVPNDSDHADYDGRSESTLKKWREKLGYRTWDELVADALRRT